MSLRVRLLLALVPLFILGLVIADAGTYAALNSYLLNRVDEQLATAHRLVEESLTGEPVPGSRGGGTTLVPFGTYGELRSPSGAVMNQQIYGPDPSSSRPVLAADLSDTSPGTTVTIPGTGSVSSYRAYVDATRDGSGDQVIIAFPLSEVSTTLTRLLLLELSISAAVTLVLAFVAWVVVRRSLRPLERIGDTAHSIAVSGLGLRVEPATERTEVGRLGLAINTMLGRLESAFAERRASEDRLRQFVSDASHELRTPLTSMRGYAELYRRNPGMGRKEIGDAMNRIEGETRRMGMLVDDLLLLARLDQGRPLEQRPVDFEGLIADACADARAIDPTRTIVARVAAPLVVTGDEPRLRQVLANLLRNALVHTPAGTPIEVALRPEGEMAVLTVVDHGPGIPAEDGSRVFERFHRSDPGRSRDQGGSGLGLSIVAAVVAAHGGTVSVGETTGGGATFRIDIPLGGSGEARAGDADPPVPDAGDDEGA